jgi:acetoin utilization deacetylase AcuC-like enzyme
MSDTVIFFDPLFEEHKTGHGHPERPERLPAAMQELQGSGLLEQVEVRSCRDATVADIELIHGSKYIEQVQEMCEAGGGHLDMDTAVSAKTYRAALRAAGALLDSVDGCLDGSFSNSFCLVRPPGHHALPNRGMGFCIFNNIAIAARYAQRTGGLSRVMIVDWDAHHGNGTQDVFYEDPSVLYVSLHQYPHYPGTGWVDETGRGRGKGFTINFPFPAGTGEDNYLDAFERVIGPAARRFSPDFMMVSAGYDSHDGDLLCSMRLNDLSYHTITRCLVDLADETCQGRLITTLEGGYNIGAQARSIVQTVAGLADIDLPADSEASKPSAYADRASEVTSEAGRLHGLD